MVNGMLLRRSSRRGRDAGTTISICIAAIIIVVVTTSFCSGLKTTSNFRTIQQFRTDAATGTQEDDVTLAVNRVTFELTSQDSEEATTVPPASGSTPPMQQRQTTPASTQTVNNAFRMQSTEFTINYGPPFVEYFKYLIGYLYAASNVQVVRSTQRKGRTSVGDEDYYEPSPSNVEYQPPEYHQDASNSIPTNTTGSSRRRRLLAEPDVECYAKCETDFSPDADLVQSCKKVICAADCIRDPSNSDVDTAKGRCGYPTPEMMVVMNKVAAKKDEALKIKVDTSMTAVKNSAATVLQIEDRLKEMVATIDRTNATIVNTLGIFNKGTALMKVNNKTLQGIQAGMVEMEAALKQSEESVTTSTTAVRDKIDGLKLTLHANNALNKERQQVFARILGDAATNNKAMAARIATYNQQVDTSLRSSQALIQVLSQWFLHTQQRRQLVQQLELTKKLATLYHMKPFISDCHPASKSTGRISRNANQDPSGQYRELTETDVKISFMRATYNYVAGYAYQTSAGAAEQNDHDIPSGRLTANPTAYANYEASSALGTTSFTKWIGLTSVFAFCDNEHLLDSRNTWFTISDIMMQMGPTGCVPNGGGGDDDVVACRCWIVVERARCKAKSEAHITRYLNSTASSTSDGSALTSPHLVILDYCAGSKTDLDRWYPENPYIQSDGSPMPITTTGGTAPPEDLIQDSITGKYSRELLVDADSINAMLRGVCGSTLHGDHPTFMASSSIFGTNSEAGGAQFIPSDASLCSTNDDIMMAQSGEIHSAANNADGAPTTAATTIFWFYTTARTAVQQLLTRANVPSEYEKYGTRDIDVPVEQLSSFTFGQSYRKANTEPYLRNHRNRRNLQQQAGENTTAVDGAQTEPPPSVYSADIASIAFHSHERIPIYLLVRKGSGQDISLDYSVSGQVGKTTHNIRADNIHHDESTLASALPHTMIVTGYLNCMFAKIDPFASGDSDIDPPPQFCRHLGPQNRSTGIVSGHVYDTAYGDITGSRHDRCNRADYLMEFQDHDFDGDGIGDSQYDKPSHCWPYMEGVINRPFTPISVGSGGVNDGECRGQGGGGGNSSHPQPYRPLGDPFSPDTTPPTHFSVDAWRGQGKKREFDPTCVTDSPRNYIRSLIRETRRQGGREDGHILPGWRCDPEQIRNSAMGMGHMCSVLDAYVLRPHDSGRRSIVEDASEQQYTYGLDEAPTIRLEPKEWRATFVAEIQGEMIVDDGQPLPMRRQPECPNPSNIQLITGSGGSGGDGGGGGSVQLHIRNTLARDNVTMQLETSLYPGDSAAATAAVVLLCETKRNFTLGATGTSQSFNLPAYCTAPSTYKVQLFMLIEQQQANDTATTPPQYYKIPCWEFLGNITELRIQQDLVRRNIAASITRIGSSGNATTTNTNTTTTVGDFARAAFTLSTRQQSSVTGQVEAALSVSAASIVVTTFEYQKILADLSRDMLTLRNQYAGVPPPEVKTQLGTMASGMLRTMSSMQGSISAAGSGGYNSQTQRLSAADADVVSGGSGGSDTGSVELAELQSKLDAYNAATQIVYDSDFVERMTALSVAQSARREALQVQMNKLAAITGRIEASVSHQGPGTEPPAEWATAFNGNNIPLSEVFSRSVSLGEFILEAAGAIADALNDMLDASCAKEINPIKVAMCVISSIANTILKSIVAFLVWILSFCIFLLIIYVTYLVTKGVLCTG